MESWTSIAIIGGATLVLGGAIIGFFRTKKAGFGRFNSAILILMMVLYVAALVFAAQKMETVSLVNLLFAIAGYAGGLLSGDSKPSSDNAVANSR